MDSVQTTAWRRAEIVRLLAQEGTVQVTTLVEQFAVTAPTIRRDLTWLVEQGLARRVRGGAMTLGDTTIQAPPHSAAARVGQAAARLVQDGETVFIGPGRLALEAARTLIEHKRLTIATNSLDVAREVADHSPHTLILSGGQFERDKHGLIGQLARAALTSLRADRVLLELGGVSAVDGLTDDALPQAELDRALLELGAQVIVLVPPERVGRMAAVTVGTAAEADVVVTAREADSAALWDLTELGLRVVLA